MLITRTTPTAGTGELALPAAADPAAASDVGQDSVASNAASTVVKLSGEARQRLAEELQSSLTDRIGTDPSPAQMTARQRKLMEKLLRRTALLEMDVSSEMREKVKAQLQRKMPLPPAQRQTADDQLRQQQQDARPPGGPA
ncbi:hypothetical protein [Herbaspirillum frisingense]|uniref:hypothetical protein n=1 Tax=Herbaspirillum frisingense TaxID=92645 RepID=UPI001F406030|nr:hypothetical protein [Herbaspirillum frisingense]UIN20549.1 hypothetical protein LAZ82_19005 [Herbaspirillum frisingense]